MNDQETETEEMYRQRCESAVDDLIRYGAGQYPEMFAADAAGAMIIAGIRVGQRAGLDLHIAKTLRLLADQIDSEVV